MNDAEFVEAVRTKPITEVLGVRCIILAIGDRDRLVALARQQLADAARVRELEEALEDVRQRGRLADHSHWDAQGNAGRTCPVCVEQVIVRERVRDALARRTP